MKRLLTCYISARRGKAPCLPLRSLLSLAVLCCSTAVYADSVDVINQANSNADRIAAQSQANITQQQQVLTQRLQALAAAMQAQNPDIPIVIQTPVQPVQPASITPPATKAAPSIVTTPNATSLTSPSQKNNNRNQWDYGF